MDLVTVTCFDDRHQMLLQAESIRKFLEPCRHWVIINDPNPDQAFWKSLLSPFYKIHELKLLFPDWNTFPNGTGHDKQQCYKLWISTFLNANYLVLDSKNFFVKPSKLTDWSDVLGSGKWQDQEKLPERWKATFDRYRAKLEITSKTTQLSIQTPFVINRQILSHFGDLNEFLVWFNSQEGIAHSEFLYYSLVAEKYGFFANQPTTSPNMYFTLWKNEKDPISSYLEKIDSTPTIKVAGFNRLYLGKLNPESLTILRNWLWDKGFRHLSLR